MTYFQAEMNKAQEAIERVRKLAEAFVNAGYQGEWTGVEIRAAILDALEGDQ